LHYLPGSPFARLFRVLAREHGLAMDDVELTAFLPPGSFFRLNPLGQVPVSESGGNAGIATLPALEAFFRDIARVPAGRAGLAPKLYRDGRHLHDLQTLQVILALGDLTVTSRYIDWTGLVPSGPNRIGFTITERTVARAAHALDWLQDRLERPAWFRNDGLSAQGVALAAVLLWSEARGGIGWAGHLGLDALVRSLAARASFADTAPPPWQG
jgi:glutathione S-transferase